MKMTATRERHGGKFLLSAIAAVVSSSFGAAQAQDGGAAAEAESTKLDTVEVTGSRIRRVDAETASPVFTIDRQIIEASGVTTVGELLQELPSISGNATNPQVNNGGGDGAAVVSLRGLDEDRTLLLLNGRRVVTQDVNAFPINLIERVEVLKEGAGAIYGSDAIGGVVNFITRKEFTGAELTYDYGVSAEGDGDRQAVSLSWGASNAKSSLMLGLNYNDQEGISAADRKFAANALYFYGSVFAAGSSRVPTGRIFLDENNPIAAQYGCTASGGEISVTRIAGTAGDSQDDFRCYQTSDGFNFQPFNLVLTPQERASVFVVGSHEVNDSVELYTEFFHNYTQSGFQIAPLPFDSRLDSIVLSGDSVYNPFNQSFGGQTTPLNQNATFRLSALGNRRAKVQVYTDQINLGIRGDVADTSWKWDATASYGRFQQELTYDGYLFQPALAGAFGPSFDGLDNDPSNGVQMPTCGFAGPNNAMPLVGANIVANCVPVNIFNLESPDQVAALDAIGFGYNQSLTQVLKVASVNFSGNIFAMPAGVVQGAFGAEYREDDYRFDTDSATQATPPLFTTCQLSSETCSGDTVGDEKVMEFYGEVLFPILAGQPFAETLNVIAGIRHSDYDSFGTATNFTGKIEYRPIADLLVRLSYAEVFRAPRIEDRFGAPVSNAATFNDPCVGLTAAAVLANPNLGLACQNVVQDGTFAQPNSQVQGLFVGDQNLGPEEGDVLTFGFVYDPTWLPGFSSTVDFWRYKLDDGIDSLDVNTIASQCVETGSADFCDLITRFSDGQIQVIRQPTANFAGIETAGVDVGFKYRMDKTPVGRFQFSVDTTYTEKYEVVAGEGSASQNVAGQYDRQFGNYARVRSIAAVNWSWMGFQALWNTRYIHGIQLLDPDAAPGEQPALKIGSHIYHDAAVGYSYEPTKTSLQIGVENVFDKLPPFLYQNNVTNANTDVETYDTVGRYFFVKLTQSF